jgi:uncharacterized protein YecA (UPF0149 family)
MHVQGALHAKNRHTEDDLKGSVHNAVSSVSPAEHRRAMNNVFVRYDSCPQAEGKQFRTLYFIYGV